MVVAGNSVVRDESRAYDGFSNVRRSDRFTVLSKGWGQQSARRRMSSIATRPRTCKYYGGSSSKSLPPRSRGP